MYIYMYMPIFLVTHATNLEGFSTNNLCLWNCLIRPVFIYIFKEKLRNVLTKFKSLNFFHDHQISAISYFITVHRGQLFVTGRHFKWNADVYAKTGMLKTCFSPAMSKYFQRTWFGGYTTSWFNAKYPFRIMKYQYLKGIEYFVSITRLNCFPEKLHGIP